MAVAEGHIPRLLHLVRLLEKRGEMSVDELAAELEVSEREVADDVRLLSTCGVPPYSPADLFEIEQEGDRVRLGRRLLSIPKLQLSAEEIAGLRLAAALAVREGWGESRALKRAVAKLEAALVPSEREKGRRLARRIAIPGQANPLGRHLSTLDRAMESGREVEMEYYAESSERLSTRQVRPYQLVATRSGRYLIAYDNARRGIRTFRVDRIQKLKLTQGRFTIPADFDPTPYLPGEAGQSEKRIEATLRFAPEAAQRALERHPTARKRQDGSVEVSEWIWPGPSFWRYVLSWAGKCELVAPAAARAGLREYAEEVAQRHGE